MENLGYLFAAYAVFWVLTFAFVFSIARRQKGLQREIESLKQALETSEAQSSNFGF
ncbi:MAG: CcmD family protein [Anaerolineae bacterium]